AAKAEAKAAGSPAVDALNPALPLAQRRAALHALAGVEREERLSILEQLVNDRSPIWFAELQHGVWAARHNLNYSRLLDSVDRGDQFAAQREIVKLHWHSDDEEQEHRRIRAALAGEAYVLLPEVARLLLLDADDPRSATLLSKLR